MLRIAVPGERNRQAPVAVELDFFEAGADGVGEPGRIDIARGGKRDAHSYEYYNRDSGIAVYTSPGVKPGAFFLYFDPLKALSQDYQLRWQIASEREEMIRQALTEAKRGV